MQLVDIYSILLKEYGPQGWWPTTQEGKTKPEYSGGPKNNRQKLEVAVGAILAQNTSWKNAERAIENLNRKNLLDTEKLKTIGLPELQEIIRPSGFYNQKAERLKIFTVFIRGKSWGRISRENLLQLKGIGTETADSILLYACGKPEFVVDAYTKRIFSRLGFISDEQKGASVKLFFEACLPKDTKIFQEFHALIVEHAKRFCKKAPECRPCPLKEYCKYYKTVNQ